MEFMPATPESAKTSLDQRLRDHAATRWPQLSGLRVRHKGGFAYIHGELGAGEVIPLMRLRYTGSAAHWGVALHLASTGKYENTILPAGGFAGTPEEALDCACGLYLTTENP